MSVYLLRTQDLCACDGETQEDYPGELTLHFDPLTPDGLPCTPANAVEVHRGSQPGEDSCSRCFTDRQQQILL